MLVQVFYQQGAVGLEVSERLLNRILDIFVSFLLNVSSCGHYIVANVSNMLPLFVILNSQPPVL